MLLLYTKCIRFEFDFQYQCLVCLNVLFFLYYLMPFYFQLTDTPQEDLARAIFIELNAAWTLFEESGSKSLF